jgi:3-oxoacyl-[acyl-carrier-protein] synthase III
MESGLPKVSSICYSVGQTKPVAALLDTGFADQQVVESLAARGILNFCEDSRSAQDMCRSCITETLLESGLRPSDIGAVVIGPSTAQWDLKEEYSFLAALASIGFSRAQIVGVSMQACCVANAALDMARLLVSSSSGVSNVLVIIFGKNCGGTRLAPQATTLFSDGAVSCIVSSAFGSLEMIGAATVTDPGLAVLEWNEPNFPQYLQSGVASLRQVCESVYAQGRISSRDIAAVFGTNGSTIYLQMIGFASGVAGSRVYRENLSRYAHVYGCDNLIGLRDRTLAQDFQPGEYVILVAWAPNVASACLFRRV